jgi:hypothetical protein
MAVDGNHSARPDFLINAIFGDFVLNSEKDNSQPTSHRHFVFQKRFGTTVTILPQNNKYTILSKLCNNEQQEKIFQPYRHCGSLSVQEIVIRYGEQLLQGGLRRCVIIRMALCAGGSP